MPWRPGDESGVLEVPSLTDQVNVTMDVEGEVIWQLEDADRDDLGLLTRQR